jgi:hypothetical protein
MMFVRIFALVVVRIVERSMGARAAFGLDVMGAAVNPAFVL